MKVVPIRRREFLGGYSSQGKETVPEWAKFLAGATLTLLAPTLLFCAISGQLLPLYLMATNEALGVVLGFVMFKKTSVGFLSCVPFDRVPKVARVASNTVPKAA
ncbi:MAG TPA: hypothetical protein VF666_11420 [Pyrinomonadaceae bacterium]|jgi:hypothetical protein